MKTRIFLLYVLLLIFGFACSKSSTAPAPQQLTQKIGTAKEVEEFVRNFLKENNIDKRVRPIIYKVEDENGKITLNVETNMADVSKKLENELKQRFPEIYLELGTLPDAQLGEKTYGIIDLSVGNMRADGKHSAEMVSQTLLGTPVKVWKKVRYWHLIQTPEGYMGWIDGTALELTDKAGYTAWTQAEKVVYMLHNGFAYTAANTESMVLGDLVLGNLLKLVATEGNFYKVQYPNGNMGYVLKNEAKLYSEWIKTAQPTHENLVATAKKFMGLPYLWGGTSAKGLDCSGFTKTIYFMNGVVLQRDASQQTLYGELVDTKNGFDKLQVGDLLFFGETGHDRVTHVAMYIGDTEFIHASGKVKINSVDSKRQNYAGDYMQNFIRARRYITSVDTEGITRIENNKYYQGKIDE